MFQRLKAKLEERRQDKKKRKLYEQRERRLYKLGGGWGNKISFCEFEAGKAVQRVHGFKHRIPKVGDVLQTPMNSGKPGYWMFTEIEPCRDPRDMFFATIQALGYEDEGDARDILPQVTEFDSQVDDVPAYLTMSRDEYYQKKDTGLLHLA